MLLNIFLSLVEVSDWNPFRANQSFSEPSWNQSGFTRIISLQSQASIWMNVNQVFNPNKSKTIQVRIDQNLIFNPNESEFEMVQNGSDWKYGLDQSELRLFQIHADSN